MNNFRHSKLNYDEKKFETKIKQITVIIVVTVRKKIKKLIESRTQSCATHYEIKNKN